MIFSLLNSFKSCAPWPPMPTPARFSFSLGGLAPSHPRTCAGSTMKPADATSEPPIKFLRDIARDGDFWGDCLFMCLLTINKFFCFKPSHQIQSNFPQCSAGDSERRYRPVQDT